MISISDLISIFQAGKDMVQSYQYKSTHDTEDYENALNALYRASSETKNYIAHYSRRKKNNNEKEKKLSKLWYKAGTKMRKYNPELAERLVIKSDYWAAPQEWTVGDIQESKIALDAIIKESRKLI